MKKNLVLLFALFALVSFAPGCGDDDDSANPDAGTDAGADTDTDTDTDADADAGNDSGTGTGGAVGDVCSSNIGTMLTMPGVCAAAATDCTAGTIVSDPQGDCGTGLTCCLDETACASATISGMPLTACQSGECALGGFQGGCADSGYCCLDAEVTMEADAGVGGDGDVCALDFSVLGGLGEFEMTGTCALDSTTCEGGTITGYEAATCGSGFQCCIDVDQCEAIAMYGTSLAACSETECSGSMISMQAGCPTNGYCCSSGF